MALQHSYEASYGGYAGGTRYSGGGYASYATYDTSLPSTAGSSSSVLNGYDGGYSPSVSSFTSNLAKSQPLDEQQIYERLADTSYKSRSEVLEHLRSVLRRSSTALPYNNVEIIFEGLALALTDSTWDVRQLAIQVIRDALPKLNDRLISCTSIVMPLLVNNIGDRKTTVRKGVTQALHCYLKQPKTDASLCLNALVNSGFNSDDPEVIRETVAIVPVLLTHEFAEMIDVSRLMSELMKKLPVEGEPVKDRLEQLALTALDKIRHVVGEGRFKEAQNRCPRSVRKRFKALQGDGFGEDLDSDPEPDIASSRIPIVQTNLHTSYNAEDPVTSTSAQSSVENDQESKYFGVIPGDVYSKLMDENPRTRLQGADELKAIIVRLQSGIALHSSLSDLLRFLSDFLDDANFKVVTTTLEIFLLLIKTAVDIRPHVGTVVDSVGRRMSDAKLLIRQGVTNVMIQLIRLVSAMPVVELLSAYFQHKNSRMRQESLNISIAALLTFPKEDFEFEFISNAVVPLLLDSKFQVRQAAMECVSVIAHLLSPGDVGVLMRAIHKVEDMNPVEGEGLANAVKVRAARHQLPRLNSDGLVEYSVALPGSASQRAVRPMPQGSDTSLILAANGGHSAARPSQSVSVFQQGADDYIGPRTPLSGKARLPWQSVQHAPSPNSNDQTAPFRRQSGNSGGFFDSDDIEELVTTPSESKANRKRNKKEDQSTIDYFKQYLETGNKRQLAFDQGSNRLGLQMPAHISSSSEVLSAPRSESPPIDVWNYDDLDQSRMRGSNRSKGRLNQSLAHRSTVSLNQGFFGEEDLPRQSIKKVPMAPKKIAASTAFEIPARDVQEGYSSSSKLSPPDASRQRGSASQRRAQKIFDRLENEDSGNTGKSVQTSKASVSNSHANGEPDEFSPQMPQRKVPALEEAFFIDFGNDKPLKPPPKFKSKTLREAEVRHSEVEPNEEPVRRNQRIINGETVMDIDNSDNSQTIPTPVHSSKPDSASKLDKQTLPDKNQVNIRYQQTKPQPKNRESNRNDTSTYGYFATQAVPLHPGRSNIPTSQHKHFAGDGRALMEEEHGLATVQKPRKEPPPIKQPAISLGALNSRNKGGLDGVEITESLNNSFGDEQFFSKSIPRSKRNFYRNNNINTEAFGDVTPPEQAFPGNATYSYIAAMEGNSSSSGIGSSSPNRPDSLNRSGMNFPSREDLSRQSTHSLMAEERLRSGDERMIEKYEELKRRQKAFLRALSANFASDVVAAEQQSLSSTLSTGSLSAFDHNRQDSAPMGYSNSDGSGSAPPKLSNHRRPLKLKPVAPPAGYQPPSLRTPRKANSPGSVAFTTFTVNAQLRAADLAYDLLPEPQPNGFKALVSASNAFNSEDWEAKCEGLNLIRSVVKHQPTALTESSHGNQLHTTNLSVIAEMRNLRSQVARLAIQTMKEMFLTLRRAMDVDTENITKVLLARTGDTNQFLRADAEQTLTAMAQNAGVNKALSALLQVGIGHRNVSVRRSTCQHVLEVVERMGPSKALSGQPEVTGQLMPALLQFLVDGSPETRFYARKICHLLLPHPDFDRILQKFCSPSAIANARDAVEAVRIKGPGELTSIGSSQRLSELSSVPSAGGASSVMSGATLGSHSSAAFKHRAPARRLDENTMDHVRTIIAQMASTDWRQRYEGITALSQLTENSPEVVSSQLTKLYDKFCPLLKDMNSKVNLHALQSFQGMLPMISNCVGPLIPLIMQHLTINLSSKSHEIQQAAAGVMHTMLAYVDPAALLQPFANQTQTANSRNKAFMVDRLAEIVDSVCDRKVKQVTLHILPLLWHLLGSVTQSGSTPGGAGNIRVSTGRLANVLYQHLGEDLIQHAGAASLPEKNYLLLQELIRINSAASKRHQPGSRIGDNLNLIVGSD